LSASIRKRCLAMVGYNLVSINSLGKMFIIISLMPCIISDFQFRFLIKMLGECVVGSQFSSWPMSRNCKGVRYHCVSWCVCCLVVKSNLLDLFNHDQLLSCCLLASCYMFFMIPVHMFIKMYYFDKPFWCWC